MLTVHAQWVLAWTTAALSSAVFLPFAWAIRGHFLRQGRLPLGMACLSAASLATYACFFACLLSREEAPRPVLSLLAFVCMVASSALFWWAIATTRTRRLNLAHSGETSVHVHSTGPYGWIRHPFYTAYMLFWFCTALLAGGWQWLPTMLLIAWYVLVARREEREFARSDMAQHYAAYRKRTGMLLPVAWPGR